METADREQSMRNETGKNDNGKRNHGQLTPDDSDANKILTTKCNLTLVNYYIESLIANSHHAH